MKVLFVGLGGVGQRHLRLLKEMHPNAEIAAVRTLGRVFEIGDDLKINENINLEEKYNISCFQSIKEAASFEPVFSIVANPTSLHIKTAQELIDHNIPVLMEKPISNNDVGLDGLIQTAKSKNIPVMVGYMMRFHPCAIKLKEYLDENILGRIYTIIVNVNSYMPAWHQYEGYNEFYAGRKDHGGGVVLTEIHEIDLLNSLFGMPKKLAACGGNRSGLDFDIEDTVSILLEFEKYNQSFSATMNMCFVQKTPLRELRVMGENGSIYWDIIENTINLYDYAHGNFQTDSFDSFERNDMFKDQLIHFIECVETGKEPMTNIANTRGSHIIGMAVKKAMNLDSFISFEN